MERLDQEERFWLDVKHEDHAAVDGTNRWARLDEVREHAEEMSVEGVAEWPWEKTKGIENNRTRDIRPQQHNRDALLNRENSLAELK
jgi:hypothetical protein